jgi:Methyltransferase domain
MNAVRSIESKSVLRRLKGGARILLAQCVAHYGYELVVANQTIDSRGQAEKNDFEYLLRGQREPFSTAGYDVLPKGEFDVVPRNYYSPIPDLSLLPPDIWQRRSDLCGVDLNPDRGMELLERDLATFIAELDIPVDNPGQPGVFFLRNSGFESVDAELLYGMIRFARPQTVIELGSGYTTLLINMAARRNSEDGIPTQHVAYDPYPRPQVLGDSLPEPTRLEAISATEVPLDVFTQLEAGDVLFVDTTHTVKLGSDVNFIMLDVLPRLKAGVLVHFHDIFLPWEYPRVWFEEMKYFWAEQYLLQGFLAFNEAFEVLLPAHAVSRTYPDRLARVVPSFRQGIMPGSFWIRRNGSRK